jgi:hypothetical protein
MDGTSVVKDVLIMSGRPNVIARSLMFWLEGLQNTSRNTLTYPVPHKYATPAFSSRDLLGIRQHWVPSEARDFVRV